MGENSKIEWTDHTFNPWVGCSKISPACDHCYAESWAKRTGNPQLWAHERRRTSPANWAMPKKWNRAAIAAGRVDRVFCASLADVFDNEVPPLWRADLFWLIHETRHLNWLLLTKRIGNAERMIDDARCKAHLLTSGSMPWPWPNVWLGATVANQEEYDRDIGKLLRLPARVRFLSIEPLLGPIDLRLGGMSMPDYAPHRPLHRLDWVIVGGESGGGARPMHPAWVRSIRDQCAAAGVPMLFKQWGEFTSQVAGDLDREPDFYMAEDGRRATEDEALAGGSWTGIYRLGKKLTGRQLDCIEHNGFPR